jgi:hypothetical protein
MARQPWPRVQAMVLCDGAQESAEEYNVFHLHGVRSRIDAPAFPDTHPRLCVYLQMSGYRGQASCHVEINRPETDETLYESSVRRVSFEGPLTVVPVLFRFRNCSFPAPGVYYVQLFCASKLLGERPLLLSGEG